MRKIVKHNKLIRDRIPKIIKEAGWKPTIRKLKKGEFSRALKKKFSEEARELTRAKDKKEIINEIVDIQELIDILVSELGSSKSKVKKLQAVKRKKRGGFKKRLFLIKQEK